MPPYTRTFIAVHFTPEIVANLEGIAQKLRASLGKHNKINWVQAQNIHLTLQFLGDVSPPGLEELAFGLSRAFVDTCPFEIELRGVGCFPTPTKPRVIWVGMHTGRQSVAALQQCVHAVTAPLGFIPEQRPFNPHVTLGRVKWFNDSKNLLAFFEKNADLGAGKCQIQAIHLMGSKLTPAGARYTVLDSFELGI